MQIIELIDTLWNVNKKMSQQELASMVGINRYIMECKLLLLARCLRSVRELIDTLWNVNRLFPFLRTRLKLN